MVSTLSAGQERVPSVSSRPGTRLGVWAQTLKRNVVDLPGMVASDNRRDDQHRSITRHPPARRFRQVPHASEIRKDCEA